MCCSPRPIRLACFCCECAIRTGSRDGPGTRPSAIAATSGIGEGFARRLARDGYDVLVHGRRRERLEALAAELRGHHEARVEVLIADLARDDELHHMEGLLVGEAPVDFLVNNAGF